MTQVGQSRLLQLGSAQLEPRVREPAQLLRSGHEAVQEIVLGSPLFGPSMITGEGQDELAHWVTQLTARLRVS